MAYARPFPVNTTMTAVSISYRNEAIGLIADDVLPRIPVGSEKFSWIEHPVGQAFTFPETEVGRRGQVNRVEFSGTERTDKIHDYGLEDVIPNTDITEAEAMRNHGLGTFDPLLTATETLTDLILLDREVRVAAKVQNPSNYGEEQRLVLSGEDQFSDYVYSDPIGVLKRAFDKTLIYRPNTMVLSRRTWSFLASHPHIVNAVKGGTTGRGIVSIEDVLKLFYGEGLKKILIGEAFINTARPGQRETISRVWGNSIELLHINPAARPENGATFGFTAEYGKRIAGSWESKEVGLLGGTVVRVGERVSEVISSPAAGFIIQNVIGTTPVPVPAPPAPSGG